jgi:hypothetical protein
MKKLNWVLIITTIVVLIVGTYFINTSLKNKSPRGYLNEEDHNITYNYSNITYDSCSQKIVNDMKLIPASQESVGAQRRDQKGNIWTKDGNDSWTSNGSGYEMTMWGDMTIDEETYPKNKISLECNKYIGTLNKEMEDGILKIVNKVAEEQSKEGINISVKKIEVFNLAGKVQAIIDLNCDNINHEQENLIIGNIAQKLFDNYPNDFAKGSKRDSWADVNCKYNLGWGIMGGIYEAKV